MKRNNLILLILLCSFHAFSQDEGEGKFKETPKYELRQKDFYEKRVAQNGETNFAESYYKANLEKEKLIEKGLNKKSKTWTPLGPFGKEQLAGIGRVNDVFFDPNDTAVYYICVAQGGLWKTNNSGKSWFNISGDLPILRTSSLAIHPLSSDTMYVALGDYAYISHNIYANGSKRNSHYGLGVYKTVNGGATWKPTGLSFSQTDFEGSLIQRIIIHPKNPNKLIAVGQQGAYYSDNGGNTWKRTNTGLFWDLEIDPVNPEKLFATTGYLTTYNLGEAGILYSNDFGQTWKQSTVPFAKVGMVQRVEIAQSPSDPAYLYAIACDALSIGLNDGFYGFYQSTDTGKTWKTKQDATYQYNLLGWDFDNSPGGQGKYDLALVVDRNDKNKVSVGGVNVWTTTDGGLNFLPATFWQLNYQNLSLHADVHSLRQHPGGRVFACHDGGLSSSIAIKGDNPVLLKQGIQISTEWTHFTSGLNITSFYRLGIHSEFVSRLMAGAQDNSTIAMTSTGTWTNLTGGDGMECTFADGNLTAYTSAQYGSIYRLDYDQKTGEYSYNSRLEIPSGESGEWTTPFVAVDEKLYVGYGNLQVYDAFDNYGQTISAFPDLPKLGYPTPISALAISNNTALQIYLAKRSYPLDQLKGEVWTLKNGTTWKDISGTLPLQNYPSYLYTLNKSGDEVWITFSGFDAGEKVYYSKDGGDNWQNISFNLPNIPVNCVVVQEDKTRNVYVGTDHAVYYLNALKNQWELYSDALPNVIISELEIHPKSSKLLAATFGRGVWQVDLASIDSSLSVNNWTEKNVIMNLSPNPAIDFVTLSLSGIQAGRYKLQVIDITGKTILSKEVSMDSSHFSEQINMQNWMAGEYFMILERENRRVVGRLVKK